jgi:hypothetical protein
MKPEYRPHDTPLFGFWEEGAVVMSAVSGAGAALARDREKPGTYSETSVRRGIQSDLPG